MGICTDMLSETAEFDYESKVWGANEVRISPRYLNALRLKYCLDDLQGVHGRVLEAGCGGGGMARAIKFYRPDLEVYGCDVSQTAIGAGQAHLGGVTFAVCDTYDLAYPESFFSAIIMFDVLEHLLTPERAAIEIYRVLKPGGLFHPFVPCEGGLHTLHGLLNKIGWKAKERYGGHLQRFVLSEVRILLGGQGFRITQAPWSGHLVSQLVDVTYFSGLSLRGRNLPYSVEGYLAGAKPGIIPKLIGGLKAGVAAVTYYESLFLHMVPGWGVHLACHK